MADRTRRLAVVASTISFVLLCAAIGVLTLLGGSSNGPSGQMVGMSGMPAHMGMTGSAMSASSCVLVSAGQLDATLGTLVQPPVASSTRRETECRYGIGGVPGAVEIRYSMDVSRGSFEELTTSLAASNNRTRHFCGLGDSAYYTQVGSGAATSTALVVLKGTNQVVIVAPGSVPQVEAIA